MKLKTRIVFYLLLASFIMAEPLAAASQEAIRAVDAEKYVGQKATVCGIVASATFASRTKGQPTFLNLDQPYPRQVFTVVIWGNDRGQFDPPPELAFKGKQICVTGLVESYRGKPEIVVALPSQIQVSK